MNTFLIITASSITLALATLAPATMALASGDDAYCGKTSGQWMSKDAAKNKAADMGYDVRRIKREDGCYEIYAIGKNCARVEIYMNPVTGTIVKNKKQVLIMITPERTNKADRVKRSAQVKVWDIAVRVFHWSLVFAFAFAFVSAEEWDRAHEVAGYFIGGLLGIRILWGFIGSKYARFSNFLYKPSTVNKLSS